VANLVKRVMTAISGGRLFEPGLREYQTQIAWVGLVLSLFVAWGNCGYYHPDEHFQVLEFAWTIFGEGSKENLSWEFTERMRSWVQPFGIAILFEVARWIGISDPFTLATLARMGSAVLAWVAIGRFVSHAVTWSSDPRTRERIIAWSYLLCFSLFIAARTSSENVSTSLFLLGFSFAYRNERALPFFAAGTLLTLSFITRFPNAPLILGFAAWILTFQKPTLPQTLSAVAGSISTFAASACLDRLGYGEWVFPAWNFLNQNLILGKAASFSSGSWTLYLTHPLRAFPPLSAVLFLFCVVGWIKRPKNPILWAILPYFAVHLFLSNRQLRFLFPLVVTAPVFAALALEELQKSITSLRSLKRAGTLAFQFLSVQNFALILALGLIPAYSQIRFMQALYREVPETQTLYTQALDPYHGPGLTHSLYRKPGLAIQHLEGSPPLEDLIETARQPFAVFLSERSDPRPYSLLAERCELRYRTLPEGVERFNFGSRGGWFNRTRLWSLYLCPAAGAKDQAGRI
jgi:phosphatidylinositol glycan class B